jgi:putative NIF3 family GTP cyclohydrolase 1 type 2
LFRAGAGWIGNYSHCSFNIPGTGTFLPQEGAQPFIGERGKLERAQEVRVETIVPESIERRAVQAMLKAHPYEEVAYDLYPMDLKGRTVGIGRIGKLAEPLNLEQFAQQAKQALDVPTVRVIGDLQREVSKVAVLGGSGGRYVRHAQFAGADVLVTGDIDYHTAHDAMAAGMSIVDAGHNIEKIMKRGVADVLQRKLADGGYSTPVTASTVSTEVFRFV